MNHLESLLFPTIHLIFFDILLEGESVLNPSLLISSSKNLLLLSFEAAFL